MISRSVNLHFFVKNILISIFCGNNIKVAQNSFQHIPNTQIMMGHNYDSLSIDATIMVSKNCPITGEHVGIILVKQ